jgi:hypothetical protein
MSFLLSWVVMYWAHQKFSRPSLVPIRSLGVLIPAPDPSSAQKKPGDMKPEALAEISII